MTANGRKGLYALVVLGGAVTMALETLNVRALAPYYGTTTFIWIANIAVVMLFMFGGNLLGGVTFSRGWGLRPLGGVMLAAAALTAVGSTVTTLVNLSLLGHPSMVTNLTLFFGALAVTVLLNNLPVLLLSMIGPWVLELVRSESPRRSATGLVYALGTAGGLVGVALPVLVLLPVSGFAVTYTLVSLCLGIAGALLFRRPLWVVLALLSCLVPLVNEVLIPPGSTVRRESALNTIWVTQDAQFTSLLMNERKAIQSRLARDPSALPLDVWTAYLAAGGFVTDPTSPQVLFLGMGGGAGPVYYHRFYPGAGLTGVEIDPVVVQLGQQYFGLDNLPMSTVHDDARVFLARTDQQFDVIVVDAYAFPYIPEHLASQEFFRLVARHLAPGGVLVCNVGRLGNRYSVSELLVATAHRVFASAVHLPLAEVGNDLYFFSARPLHFEVPPGTSVGLQLLLHRLAQRFQPLPPSEGLPVSTDGHPQMEARTHLAMLEYLGFLP